MLTGARAQEYDRLRSLGHAVDCAFDMADGAACICKNKAIQAKPIVEQLAKKRGRPRQYQTGAARQAAYRERHLVRLADLAGQVVALEMKS
jgi:hypothetical protein